MMILLKKLYASNFRDTINNLSGIFLNFKSLIIGMISVVCSIILIVVVVFLIKKFKFGSHHLNCRNKKIIKSRKDINKKDDVILESFSIFNKN